ncbi:Gfo/Idh/MocA family oxidoreductase [bacterium]|nr:Gfo/Idh/MocA family oxidoreductase [bacterium]
MIGLGVVGLGGWGPNLLRNAANTQGAEVRIVCDANADRLAAVAQAQKSFDQTTELVDVLSRQDVDAVILATPAGLHFQHATAALEAGKHVLVEKPMALTAEEGRILVRRAKEVDRLLMVGHTFLYNDAVAEMKRLVDAGELGRVYSIMAERMSLGKIRDDVNAMWNLSPHDFSIVLHLLGEMPRRVWAKGGVFLPGSQLHDVVIATLEFPSGALVNVYSSWLNPIKIRRMTVVGDKKMLVYDDVSSDRMIVVYEKSVDSVPFDDPSGSFKKFQHHIRTGGEQVSDFEFREPLAQEIAHFADCIANGKTPRSDGEEGLRVLRVLEACQNSLESNGLPIELLP